MELPPTALPEPALSGQASVRAGTQQTDANDDGLTAPTDTQVRLEASAQPKDTKKTATHTLKKKAVAEPNRPEVQQPVDADVTEEAVQPAQKRDATPEDKRRGAPAVEVKEAPRLPGTRSNPHRWPFDTVSDALPQPELTERYQREVGQVDTFVRIAAQTWLRYQYELDNYIFDTPLAKHSWNWRRGLGEVFANVDRITVRGDTWCLQEEVPANPEDRRSWYIRARYVDEAVAVLRHAVQLRLAIKTERIAHRSIELLISPGIWTSDEHETVANTLLGLTNVATVEYPQGNFFADGNNSVYAELAYSNAGTLHIIRNMPLYVMPEEAVKRANVIQVKSGANASLLWSIECTAGTDSGQKRLETKGLTGHEQDLWLQLQQVNAQVREAITSLEMDYKEGRYFVPRPQLALLNRMRIALPNLREAKQTLHYFDYDPYRRSNSRPSPEGEAADLAADLHMRLQMGIEQMQRDVYPVEQIQVVLKTGYEVYNVCPLCVRQHIEPQLQKNFAEYNRSSGLDDEKRFCWTLETSVRPGITMKAELRFKARGHPFCYSKRKHR
ncbi:hypothetical protein AAVH_12914 [Aphelenchoides avenae]|nr:hypothetical protein AAVH_12914 [Aphelenchus avenae]